MSKTLRKAMRLSIAVLAMAGAAGVHAVTAQEQEFLRKADQAGELEMQASRLAATHTQNVEVRRFADAMLHDHQMAAEELERLARRKGVALPAGPTPETEHALARLESLQQADFDREYADTIGVKAHHEAVALFRQATKDSRDKDVQAFAVKTLPALERHLQMAERLTSDTRP
ncbi:hypothetical protein BKK80_34350 [Cupriavidus malaysiensis]|uniref:DUF4142 domain-containing protein n=2 Tax=Cupriavidus malaysiensis TaxID=367825 RepID=A0ABM6FFC9_9BURK|nr:hypothetical protein BKK80_34350 [Cupriavidus malaysiensis]